MTIWRLRRDGELPKPKKLGNRNVTLEDDVDRAMELIVGA
jgi:predicted DNA-binding transcriptional regulator AlpA